MLLDDPSDALVDDDIQGEDWLLLLLLLSSSSSSLSLLLLLCVASIIPAVFTCTVSAVCIPFSFLFFCLESFPVHGYFAWVQQLALNL